MGPASTIHSRLSQSAPCASKVLVPLGSPQLLAGRRERGAVFQSAELFRLDGDLERGSTSRLQSLQFLFSPCPLNSCHELLRFARLIGLELCGGSPSKLAPSTWRGSWREPGKPAGAVDQALITSQGRAIPAPPPEIAVSATLLSGGIGRCHAHHIRLGWCRGCRWRGGMAQRILQQKSAEIGDGAALFLRSCQQFFVDVVAQRDGDTPWLALQHSQSIVHR